MNPAHPTYHGKNSFNNFFGIYHWLTLYRSTNGKPLSPNRWEIVICMQIQAIRVYYIISKYWFLISLLKKEKQNAAQLPLIIAYIGPFFFLSFSFCFVLMWKSLTKN